MYKKDLQIINLLTQPFALSPTDSYTANLGLISQ